MEMLIKPEFRDLVHTSKRYLASASQQVLSVSENQEQQFKLEHKVKGYLLKSQTSCTFAT